MRMGAEGAADRASVSARAGGVALGRPTLSAAPGGPRDAAVDTTSGPSARARCPKAEGRETPPLLPPLSMVLHPPARHTPSALGILPAAPAARGACPPSRRHSGRRRWLAQPRTGPRSQSTPPSAAARSSTHSRRCGGNLYLGRHRVQGLVPPPPFCWFVYLSLRLFPPSQVPSAFGMTQGEAIHAPPPPPPRASGHTAWA